MYGRETMYDPYDGGRSRKEISPSQSHADIRNHSRSPSGNPYQIPQSRGSQYAGSVLDTNGQYQPAALPYEQTQHGSMYGSSQYGGGGGDGYLYPDGSYPQQYNQTSRPLTTLRQESRPQSNFLPEYTPAAPLALSASEIPVATLENSIERICASADLDTLTKKGVRKQLEREFGVDLNSRKEVINQLIEKVLTSG